MKILKFPLPALIFLTLLLVGLPSANAKVKNLQGDYKILYNPTQSKLLNDSLTDEELKIIEHVKQSIDHASKKSSKIRGMKKKKILKINGMSSKRVRHLLNNLCSMPSTNYLEIGTWKGATWIAALYNNHKSIVKAIAIDNWSQFGGPKQEFENNCSKFLKKTNYQLKNEDCFKLNPATLFDSPVNIYFYDGDHSKMSQEKAFTHYNEIFNEVFIALVDDWHWEPVRRGTFEAFTKLNYVILFEKYLPGSDGYWNGQYIAVIRKQDT